MSGAELLALADRVEALAGACRLADFDIARAVYGRSVGVAKWTASFDAAMKLVPEGMLWTMDSWEQGWSAGIWRPQKGWLLTHDRERMSCTPALALTAAALRARAKVTA